MKRVTVVAGFAVALGALGLGAWEFLRGDRHSFTAEPRAPDPADIGTEGPATERAAVARDVEGRPTSGDEAADSALPVVPSIADEADGRTGPTLIVIEKETGRPRPDAAVRLVADDAVSDDEWNGLIDHDPAFEPLIDERGIAVELDALATVVLPWQPCKALVFADVTDRRGRRQIDLGASTHIVLRLVRREALTILAVDPGGRPQGDVPVSLQVLQRGDPWQGSPRLCWTGVTDKDGEAVVPHGSELLDEHLDADGLATEEVVVAALAFPCRDPSPRLVDPRSPGEQVVRLVTPTRGTFRLQARGERGLPYPSEVVVRSFVPGPPVDPPVKREWFTRIPTDGIVPLVVESGVTIELSARSRNGRDEAKRSRWQTPGRAESLDVKLALEPIPEPPFCTVHVVDGAGDAVVSTELHWQLTGEANQPIGRMPAAARSDPDGVMRIESALLDNRPREMLDSFDRDGRGVSRPTRLLEVFGGLHRPFQGGALCSGAIPLPAIQPSDALDLGKVMLTDVPLLLAGRIVDTDGLGVRDVDLTVEEAIPFPKSWSTRTDRDGLFVIHSLSVAGWLEVWPERELWYRPGEYRGDGEKVPLRVARGRSDLEITLHREGWARGRLLVDPGISFNGLVVKALPNPPPDVRARMEADGTFLVHGAPGTRTLVVLSRLGRPTPIAAVADFLLEEGKETVEPRLDPIDLRRTLRQVELEVHGADGDPLAGAVLSLILGADAVLPVERTTDAFGRAIVTTPAFGADVVVGHPDHCFKRLAFEPALQRVQLEPAKIVRVSVEGPVNDLLASKSFLPCLSMWNSDPRGVEWQLWHGLPPPVPRKVDATTFELKATLPTEYGLWWKRRVEDPDDLTLHGPKRIRVRPGDSVVKVTERFTQDDAARIRAQLHR